MINVRAETIKWIIKMSIAIDFKLLTINCINIFIFYAVKVVLIYKFVSIFNIYKSKYKYDYIP